MEAFPRICDPGSAELMESFKLSSSRSSGPRDGDREEVRVSIPGEGPAGEAALVGVAPGPLAVLPAPNFTLFPREEVALAWGDLETVRTFTGLSRSAVEAVETQTGDLQNKFRNLTLLPANAIRATAGEAGLGEEDAHVALRRHSWD